MYFFKVYFSYAMRICCKYIFQSVDEMAAALPVKCKFLSHHSYVSSQLHTIPYHTISYHTIPYWSILYHIIPYHTILKHTIPYHTIPYHIKAYHTIPYQTIPYHTRHISTPPIHCSACHFNLLIAQSSLMPQCHLNFHLHLKFHCQKSKQSDGREIDVV